MLSSSRWPSVIPVTLGEGAGEGEGEGDGGVVAGVETAAGAGVACGVGCCALARTTLVANIPEPIRNVRNSEFVVLLFIIFLPSGRCEDIAVR